MVMLVKYVAKELLEKFGEGNPCENFVVEGEYISSKTLNHLPPYGAK